MWKKQLLRPMKFLDLVIRILIFLAILSELSIICVMGLGKFVNISMNQ